MCSSTQGAQPSSSEGSCQIVNNDVGRRASTPAVMDRNSNASTSSTRIRNVISKRRRAIYIFYFVAFLDLLAVSLFLPLLTKLMRDLGATAVMTGLVGSVYGAIQLISSPVVGWGSDIYGQKLVMIVCLMASAVAYIVQGLAFNIAFMLIARVLAGIFKHTQTLGKSIVSELSSRDKSYVIGNFNAFGSMGFIVGPPLGAHIAELENGFQMVCFLSASAFILNAVLILFLVPDTSALVQRSPQKSEKNGKRGSGFSLFMNGDVHSIILLGVRFLFSFATLVFRENLTLVLQDKYGSTMVNIGYLLSLQSLVSTMIGFAVGPVNAFIYRGNSLYMVLVTGILKTAVLITLYLSSTYTLAAAMLVCISGLNPFLRVGVTAISLEGHPDDIGIILGLSQSATSVARMVSPALAGLAFNISPEGPFILASISAFCGVLATLVSQRYTYSRRQDAQHSKSE